MDSQPLNLLAARAALPSADFRAVLRRHLLDHPTITLHQVAQALGVTRQRVGLMVGPLNRPTCAHPNRPAPKLEQARKKMASLVKRVQTGEPAEQAAAALGISLSQAMKLGFRVKHARPAHGTAERAAAGCTCWRCRRAAGAVRARGPRVDEAQRSATLDWLAWVDPDTDEFLSQAAVGKLVGMRQGAVSRIARAQEAQ